ncbi:hypothetical protein ACFO5Q_00180 [Kordiimonas lipolytica]|uniref:Uncharacterized protein n=1 Tax=Kordiimonas lipolytica TaxID=1662421 RepID=A0ABV8U5Z8_9PROT|nr:hypothetical protein [Kordiimonas lipolytica]
MTAKRLTSILITAATSFAIGGAATADHRDPRDLPDYDAESNVFRTSHPIRVFVDVDSKDERREAGVTAFEAQAFKHMRYALPNYVEFVRERHHADMIVRAREKDYRFGFRVVDTDRKDKKYKKHARNTGGRCGHFQKAYYTKVKEKGEAYASYGIKIAMHGYGRDTDFIELRSAENFSYGTDLVARTNCGMVSTYHMPSSGVAELFARNTPEYRNHVAREVREEAAADLGRALAHKIRNGVDHYYLNLATRLSQADYDRYSRRGGDYGRRSEYDHHAPRPPLAQNQHFELEDDDLGAAVFIATGLAILAATLDD